MHRVSRVDDSAEINLMIPIITSIWKNTSIRSELADTLRAVAYNGGLVLHVTDNDEERAILIGSPGHKRGKTYLYARIFLIKDHSRTTIQFMLFAHLKQWALENDYNRIVTEIDPFNLGEVSFYFEKTCPISIEPVLLDVVHDHAEQRGRYQCLRILLDLPVDLTCAKNEPAFANVDPVAIEEINLEPSRYVNLSVVGLQVPSNIDEMRRLDPWAASRVEKAAYDAFQSLVKSGFMMTGLLNGTTPLYLFMRKLPVVVQSKDSVV